ncbi:hypothetical protein NC796_25745 [Aliifodinibius sp. S!AR15-10]|uniref:BP74-related protein n=1 Tax=Aliifodinibius sp. S!AR15-10 TaxID=2950437 RepID=UPI0028595557|nr:hypothetical protein [Aliifodinibius sp. S!AR15-10]MDR8394575.1 hypothetical protein [Aliifodinibius sp. S!AR15-10]
MNAFCRAKLLWLFSLLFALSSCGTSTDGEEVRYYEFTHQDEEINYSFIAKTSNPDVIANVEEELAKPFDERSMHINGDIARGNDGYNQGWSWHFLPEQWDLASVSTEVCDGRPGMVEEDLDYWVDQVGYFCPWSSRVLREVDP